MYICIVIIIVLYPDHIIPLVLQGARPFMIAQALQRMRMVTTHTDEVCAELLHNALCLDEVSMAGESSLLSPNYNPGSHLAVQIVVLVITSIKSPYNVEILGAPNGDAEFWKLLFKQHSCIVNPEVNPSTPHL